MLAAAGFQAAALLVLWLKTKPVYAEPACSFDVTAREIMSRMIAEGYCQALLAGNALATHDLEGAYLGTALGCDIRNQKLHHMGHYNHLETINAINTYGSIPAFIE